MRHLSALWIGLAAISLMHGPAAFAQSQSITPSATTSGDGSDVSQSNSTSSTSTTTTQDQDVTNSSTNTISGDQINNTYISGSSSGTGSIRPGDSRDPLRARDYRDRDNGDRQRDNSRDAYQRDLLRASTASQRADLVDNKIEAEQDRIRADRLLNSTQRGAYNAQSINNRASDTGADEPRVTGPAAKVQFAPQPAPTPIVVVPPVTNSRR